MDYLNERNRMASTTGSRGLLGWWLRLTAPAGAGNYDAAADRVTRERLRRAGLTSAVAPFVAVAPLLLSGQARVDNITLAGTIALPLIVIFALFLNRISQQTSAAIILVLGMDAVIQGALVGAGAGTGPDHGLGTGWLLTFDLFIIPLITVGLLLSRNYLWPFAILHISFIVGDFYLLHHAKDLDSLVTLWNGAAIAYARPILIQIGGAILSFSGIRSIDLAIARADRAEEIARLESIVVEQKRALDQGVFELTQAFVRAANGDYNSRVNIPRQNPLWSLGAQMNTFVQRLQQAGMATYELERTRQESFRLVAALDDWRAGRLPIWPAPSQTLLDPIIQRLGGPRNQG